VENRPRIPLWLKLAYTLYLCVLVPVYWVNYTPANFLFFCDLALFVTLAALWLENRLLASMAALGILLPQFLWVVDFLVRLVAGISLLGMTSYMFDPQLSLFLRGLSLFHGWLPFLLFWMVWRLGYDRRALGLQTVLAWVVLLISYFGTPPPPAPADNPSAAVNVNYVFAFPWDESKTQEAMPPWLWLACLMAFFPLALFLPTHLALVKLFGRPMERTPRTMDQEGAATSPAARAGGVSP
jgi:hypothetical protein